MKKFILIFIFLIPFISAVCEDGQININSASAVELEDITGVGPKVAGYIIEGRPFDSIDDLIDVKWIGPATLEKIKIEDLACVSGEQTEQEEEIEEVEEPVEEEEPIEEEKMDVIEPLEIEIIQKEKTPIKIENEVIDLSPQNIKSEDYNESLSKEDYAKYGLGLFCVLLFGLFVFKKNQTRKNEFR
jgi:competence ComEA-like helix-hairpin-helix protein